MRPSLEPSLTLLLPSPTSNLISSLVCLLKHGSLPSDSYSVCRLPFEHIHDFFLFSVDPFKHSTSSTYIYTLAFKSMMAGEFHNMTIWSESSLFDRDHMTCLWECCPPIIRRPVLQVQSYHETQLLCQMPVASIIRPVIHPAVEL